jgi:hypothetical protein
VHDGQFGNRCEQCHGVDGWKKIRNRVGGLTSDQKTLLAAHITSTHGGRP